MDLLGSLLEYCMISHIIFSSQELRRIKPVPKLACHSVASWCHPRAPNLDILTCVKDSHIWYDFFYYYFSFY